ncbi:SLBB domain-containing protein [Dysgonomonas massiliensis]|uniref:SLBB domain-containing protein n=1 Tax=Dysgonomonas massiliensis TaxID=2040292 RepID=UPI0016131B99|nr:SLBB domain-containing protein [Dysgonomonas massiliensis]
MIKKIFFLLILIMPLCLSAQMSDSQVIEYVKTEHAKGTSQDAIGKALLQRGVTQAQLLKIKSQVEQQQNQSRGASSAVDSSISVLREEQEGETTQRSVSLENIPLRRVFGKDVFSQKDLTFAPTMNIPTPANYKLGAGDEVVIDIWGASQTTIRRTITPEGTISIESLGPVFLSGMTIEQANEIVRRKLSNLYAGVDEEGGASYISLTLGQIRSIQVNVMGEVVTPGTYTVSSLSSVFHALYLAGGINDIGSLRTVNLYRGGKKVASVDIYDFILHGQTPDDIRLSDGDVIIVPAHQLWVNIEGEVKRPMIYEMTKDEHVSDLINYAGGFTGEANTDNISLSRKTGKYRQMYTLNPETMISFTLSDGDNISVRKGLDRYENRVQIQGSVLFPGYYEIGGDIKTVADLIKKAGGLKEDAFLDRAVLTREKDDLTFETLALNLNNLESTVSGNTQLKKNDVLYIAANTIDEDLGDFTITGMVANPGQYSFAGNTTIKDLIVRAGGLLSSASTAKIDVSRRIIDPSSTTDAIIIAETYSFSIVDGLIADGKSDFILEPYDQVYVRRSPGYQQQRNVSVIGEVLFPGGYTLTEKEQRVSDIIKAAGGLTNKSYAAGARLVRKMNDDEKARQKEYIEMISRGTMKDSVDMESLDTSFEYTVGIELDKAVAKPRSEYDIVLREGDRLYVPEFTNTIKINGAVMHPNTVLYKKGEPLKYYIDKAGGYSDYAQKKRAYIVYMNGMTAKAKGSSKDLIKPGCEIIVPTKEQREKMSLGQTIAIGSSVTSMASVIALLINSLTK